MEQKIKYLLNDHDLDNVSGGILEGFFGIPKNQPARLLPGD